jgi:glycosyltransferase involved in cell wall biosynthesis
MRILMIIPQAFYTTRGTPLSAYHRAKELIARGHEVDILTYAVGDDPPDPRMRVFRARGPHFARSIAAGPSRPKIWFDLLLFLTLLARLTRNRYDVLYAHEEGAFLARLAGAVFRPPYIYDMHSSLPLQITDWRFSRNRRVVGLFRWVERVSIRGARAVVAISPAVAEVAHEVCATVPVVTIVNQFETGRVGSAEDAALIRSRHGIDAEAPLVLYTGSFVALQGLDMLIESAALVLREHPEVRFLLVGGANEEIAGLRAQAERLGIADKVVFELSRPQEEMPAYMAAADVLVSPRTQGINPPGKLLSYLASGRPVVATATLVHTQLLDEQCAFLAAPNAAGLAKALTDALTNELSAAAHVRAARQFLERHGSKAARDAAYDTLLGAVTRRGTAPTRPAHAPQILTTSYEYPPLGGGGAKVASGVAQRVAECGYEVDLVTMGFRGLPSEELIAGVRVHRIPSLRMRLASCSAVEMIPYVLFAVFWLIRRVRLNDYLINHCHFIFPDGIVAFVIKRLTGLPFVITAHGSDVPGYNPHRFRRLHRLLLPLWRRVTSEASMILCPSASIRELIIKSNPRARTAIVPNAIELDKFIPGSKQARRLLIVTRMFERKGVQYVIQALACTRERFDVHIVGDGPYLATVEALAQRLGVIASFWGHLDNDSAQLKNLYATAAIFVFTSEAENFPIVLLEAMAAGTAIVTTRGTGCEEVVGDAALLVPVRDSPAITTALDSLSQSPELVQRLSAAAHQRVSKRFGWEGTIAQHLAIFAECSGGRMPLEQRANTNAARS